MADNGILFPLIFGVVMQQNRENAPAQDIKRSSGKVKLGNSFNPLSLQDDALTVGQKKTLLLKTITIITIYS